jgi:hypothetical protein
VWNLLYDVNSGKDIGTLYAANNFLNAKNVPLNPMDDVDASYEFLEQYTEALILAAYEEVKGSYKPIDNLLPAEQESAMNSILDKIVDEFAIPSISSDWRIDDAMFKCSKCDKRYKRIASLRKHNKEKHSMELDEDVHSNSTTKDIECKYCKKKYMQEKAFKNHMSKKHPRQSLTESASSDSSDDFVYRYSCSALCLGLLALDFNDARKLGDGNRIIKLYKFLFLLFRFDGRTKYAFYSFQLLCQVFYLLPERLAFSLVHNRFTNNKGDIDSNVEMDREVEHWNKPFKMDCKEFHGKVTDNSIERASCSYQEVEKVLARFDIGTKTHSPSGKHSRKNILDDVRALSEQLKNSDLFREDPAGRSHDAYPGFSKNLLGGIEAAALKEWMQKQIKHFKELNIYDKLTQ